MALKAWLPLNKDLRCINFENISVTNHNVTLDNNGVFGKSHYFSGSSYLQFNNLNISNNQQLSLSFWCYSTNGNLSSLFVCRNSSTHQISLYSTNLYFRDSKHSSLTSFTFEQPSENVWTHYVIIYDNGNWIIYKNGVKVKEQVYSSAVLNSIDEIRIGRYQSSSGNEYFTGKLNDFRIYDHALTEEDVKRIYQQKLFELIPYSGVKDVLFDMSGFMNMPLVNNGADFQTNCLYFDGTNDQLRPKVTNDGFNISGGTLSIWFAPTEKPNKNRLIYTDEKSHMSIGFSSTGKSLVVRCGTSNGNTNGLSTTGISWGSLNNVIVTYNNTMPQICLINGIVPSVYTTSTGFKETAGKGLTIGGRQYNTTSRFDGKIYKVAVYNRQFTQDEAVKLYNSERGMFLPDDYIQLEYIQGDKQAYIDTNFVLNSDCSAEAKFCFISAEGSSTGNFIMGCRKSYGNLAFNLVGYSGGAKWASNYGSATGDFGNSDTNIHILKRIKEKVYLDGDLKITTQQSSFTTPGNAYIFSCNQNDTPYLTSNIKLWYLKIWENDLLVRNFIPAKRKSDNVIGMYDMVSRQFFTNSGTGSFTGA